MSERKVTIEFTRPKGHICPVFSCLIRLVERTPYSHVRLRWETGRGVPCVYEASGAGLKFKGPIADKDSVVITDSFDIPITKQEMAKLVDLCVTYADVDYGVTQIFGIAVARLLGMAHNPFSQGDHNQICSEVALGFLEDIMGWETGLNRDLAGVKDIYNFLKGR